MKKKIIVIGAGSFAGVLLDTILKQGEFEVKGFCVDGIVVGDFVLGEYPVLGDAMLSNLRGDSSVYFIVAMGDNKHRQKFYENALTKFTPAIIVHPSAILSANTKIGKGSILLANSVVNENGEVGCNCIINSGVVVDHDSVISDHVHLSIGTLVSSKSKIDSFFTSEIGEVIKSPKNIGL